MTLLGRRAFLRGMATLLTLGMAGCTMPPEPDQESELEQSKSEQEPLDAQLSEDEEPQQEEEPMKITVTVNGTSFTATIEDGAAGRELMKRLPLTLQMDELHGNEKYCYTGESFGGDQFVPGTIEAGDLMVFGSDCFVLFYETFSNGGWSYVRVGKIDDPTGLAEACGSGIAVVEFASLA